MKKKEIDSMTKKHNILSSIIDFFKRIFKVNTNALLPDGSSIESETQDFRQDTKKGNNASDKETTMFLYKQLRLGNINPKYIPDQYLEKIIALLNEEKKIKQKELDKINQEIVQNEQKINKYSKDIK